MKKSIIILFSGLVTSTLAFSQLNEDAVVRVIPPIIASDSSPAVDEDAPEDQGPSGSVGPADAAAVLVVANPDNLAATKPAPGAAGGAGADEGAAGGVAADEAAAEGQPIEAEDGGFLIKDANINDIFQLLAKRGGKQYFHNNKLSTDDFKVTGHLNGDGSPLTQMEELAFQYGLRMYVKGNTVYAMMDEQLEKLPAKEWTYSLKYLRPTDIEQIKALIQPMLTASRGIVNFEPKTNTIVVIDTMHHIEMVERLLKKIDKPKGQIVIEVKILRINSTVGKYSGVDWASSLGASGISIDAAASLNALFGLPEPAASSSDTTGTTEGPSFENSDIVLSPFQLSGVLRALNEGNLVTQKSNPVVITEDNERASISLIDRVPIITSTITTGTGPTTQTDEVRYTIDESDSTDPDKTREIGVTMTMRPSLLPDGTIRMDMRPRNAQIVENIKGPSGNIYPRVSEATIQSIARIPNGYSLIIGGFYGELTSKGKNKVPLLGDIPIINFFFKSKETRKEHSSLVFVVTPTSYDPSCAGANNNTTKRLRNGMSIKPKHDWVEDSNPGPAHEPNMRRTIRGMKPKQAPYYPKR